MLSLFKREYPKGEGVIRSYYTKVLSKLLHRKRSPSSYKRRSLLLMLSLFKRDGAIP